MIETKIGASFALEKDPYWYVVQVSDTTMLTSEKMLVTKYYNKMSLSF